MKKLAKLAAVVVLGCSSMSGINAMDIDKRIGGLYCKLNELIGKVSVLEQQISKIAGQISVLNKQVSELKGQQGLRMKKQA